MNVRSWAADDATTIGKRMQELAAERKAILDCTCERSVGARGEIVRSSTAACSVHHGSVEG